MKKVVIPLAIAVAFMYIAAGVFGYQEYKRISTPPKTVEQKIVQPTVSNLLESVNAERAKAGVAPLRLDPLLSTSAQLKAEDMDKNNYFGHVDSTGKHGWEYINDVNKECSYSSENIVETNNLESAIYSWTHSVPHYKAMIDSRYTETGFGISGDKIVEHFCIAK